MKTIMTTNGKKTMTMMMMMTTIAAAAALLLTFQAQAETKALGTVKNNERVVVSEDDPQFNNWYGRPGLTFTNETAEFAAGTNAFILGGHPLGWYLREFITDFSESDPTVPSWAKEQEPPSETDPVFSTWLGDNTYVKEERDPSFVEWTATNEYVKAEADPRFWQVFGNPVLSLITYNEINLSAANQISLTAPKLEVSDTIVVGPNNLQIADGAGIVGSGNMAGVKAWYYTGIQFSTNEQGVAVVGPATLYLTADVQERHSGSLEHVQEFESGYQVGDVLSIVNKDKLDNICRVTSVDGNAIMVDNLPFTNVVDVSGADFDDWTVMTTNRPQSGALVIGDGAFAVGSGNKALRRQSMVFGRDNTAYGDYAFIGGRNNSGAYGTLAAGRNNQAIGWYSFAWGQNSVAGGKFSMSGGNKTSSGGDWSVALGYNTSASGNYGFAHGFTTTASGSCATALGGRTAATGSQSVAEGYNTTASGPQSHAEGTNSVASGKAAHAEGVSRAYGNYSHAGGWDSKAYGTATFVHGNNSTAATNYACVLGNNLIASNVSEFVCGKWNNPTNKNLLFSIGVGTSNSRANAIEVTSGGTVRVLMNRQMRSLQELLTSAGNKIESITTNGVALSINGKAVDIPLQDYVRLSDLQDGISFNTMTVTNLTINGKHPSLEGHAHTVSEIDDLQGLWSIPGAETAATNAIAQIQAAQNDTEVKAALIQFLNNFKKPSQ